MPVPVPALHLPLNGNLDGTAVGAPVSATGNGALRYRASDIGGKQAALVEVGATNYAQNPLARSGGASWGPVNSTPTYSAALPGVILSADGSAITTCLHQVLTGNVSISLDAVPANLPTAGTFTFSRFVWLPSGSFSATGLRVGANNYAGGSVTSAGVYAVATRGQWQRCDTVYAVVDGDKNGHNAHQITAGTAVSGNALYTTGASVVAGSWSGSIVPEVDSAGDLLPGYSWAGSAHASASIRAATTIAADYDGTIEHAFCRYSEDFGATWQTASLTTEGAIGTYGAIDLTDEVLTIESSRALMLRDFVVYDVELTSDEQDAVEWAIEQGVFGKRRGHWPGLMLPV